MKVKFTYCMLFCIFDLKALGKRLILNFISDQEKTLIEIRMKFFSVKIVFSKMCLDFWTNPKPNSLVVYSGFLTPKF